jgi:hypothetical protein
MWALRVEIPGVLAPIMTRNILVLSALALASLMPGCGSGAGPSGPSSTGDGGGGTPQNIPTLTAIAPSSATVGTSAVSLTLYGSNFENGASALWNGTALSSSWVSSAKMTATIPASDIASIGTAKITVANPNPGGGTSTAQVFTVAAAPVATTWVRTVTGVTTPQDIVWDAAHGMLYVSIASSDTVAPNTIAAVNPLTGAVSTSVVAGNNPDLLSISSDSSYLWAGLDGDNAVQRFLLPGLTKDISFQVPPDAGGRAQQPVSLEAAPVNPHLVAVVAGNWGYSPVGEGVYVYDDGNRRSNFVPGPVPGPGPMIDWIQWGENDSTIFGNQYTTADAGGVATLNVAPSGISLKGYNGGQIGPGYTQYDNGLLYSTGSYFFGRVFNPVDGGLAGLFELPELGNEACTADSSLGRYYCVEAYALEGSLFQYELFVFDLNSYALLNRVSFGSTAGAVGSPITGGPAHLVRWGNAGLALTTTTQVYRGNAGVFLIDGLAVNPNASPDVSSGASTVSYTWMASLTPQQASVGSGAVTVTINGTNFTPTSSACWNCSYIQLQYLPTTCVSSQQLNVTIPANLLANVANLPISVFDSSTNLFSTNALTFSVMPAASGSNPTVKAIDVLGYAMGWDNNSSLLYVGTGGSDGAYPNSIVAVDPQTGSIVKAQTVSPEPDLVSISANGQYLYTAFAGATSMTQLKLPGLDSPLTWTLSNPTSSAVFWAGDMKVAPISPHTTAVTLFNHESNPQETGGVVIYDDNVARPDSVNGWGPGPAAPTIYDALAWSSSDQILTAACFPVSSSWGLGCISPGGELQLSPLYEFQVTSSGTAFVAAAPANFSTGELHSDFGTGLIYSDDGNVADPRTQALVGTYNASGLLAPDSSLNRVFILGQTAAQANTNNFTIESFDQTAYTPVSSITVDNLLGSPFELIRCGPSCLAILTVNPVEIISGYTGSLGMLYLIQDTSFVNSARSATSHLSVPQESVQRRWKRISKADILRMTAKTAAILR